MMSVEIVLYVFIAIPYEKDIATIHRIDLAVRHMTRACLKKRQTRKLPRASCSKRVPQDSITAKQNIFGRELSI